MKRLILLSAVALMTAAACTKNETSLSRASHEIAFQTVTYITKAGITGTEFPTTETFGVYAWSAASESGYFMNNEVVQYNNSVWKPASTYYWPKNATVDFFCFYPARMAELAAGEQTFSINGFDVVNNPVDLMYSDKAVGFTDNVDEVEDDAVSGYTGVPAIFRHALAKVAVNVLLPYNHKEEADGTITDWTVTVNSASLSGLYKSGDVTLNLASSPAIGIVPWEKPADANGFNVWTNDGTVASYNATVDHLQLGVDQKIPVFPEFFVLPQALANGQQMINLNVTIKTIRNGQPFLSETFDLAGSLYLDSLPAWEMNHSIVYIVTVNPTSASGNGGNPYNPDDPADPNKPDPDDPVLDDAVITFDPAIDGWDVVTASATIRL